MKKLIFVFFAVILTSTACTQSQGQSDFYGTWVYESKDSIGKDTKMEYVITGAIFTATWTPGIVSFITPVQSTVYEIFAWEKITNEDENTRRDYPSGFLLGLRAGLENTTFTLFIHRNKNSIISAYEYGGDYVQEVYVKQSPVRSNQQERAAQNTNTPEYELCMGVLENDIAMVQRAINRGVDVNNVRLKNEEARTIRRSLGYWMVDNLPEVGATREEVDMQFERPPRGVDLDDLDLSEMPGGLLIVPVMNDNLDMVRLLINTGQVLDIDVFGEMESDVPISNSMRALLIEAITPGTQH